MKGLEAKTGLWDLKREHLAVQCIKLFKVKVLVTELCLILQPDTGMDCHSFSKGTFWPRNRTQVSYIAGRFFISTDALTTL